LAENPRDDSSAFDSQAIDRRHRGTLIFAVAISFGHEGAFSRRGVLP
jgi:hypothetical protein